MLKITSAGCGRLQVQGVEDVEDYKCRVWKMSKITSAGCGRCRRLQVLHGDNSGK